MEDDLKNIEKVFGKVTRADATFEVKASAKYYTDSTRVFIPFVPYRKLVPFMEEDVDTEDWTTRVKDSSKTSNEDNLERSLRKTKTLITDYMLCNEFSHFVTFTFDPKKSDRTNPVSQKKQMTDWLHNQRNRNGRFSYIIVPEFHADRKALHFHAVVNDYPGILLDSGKKQKGKTIYNLKGYTLGFTTAVEIDNYEKVIWYLQKYITKDMPQFFGQRRFWTSNGLRKPKIEDNPSDWYLREAPLRTVATEYGVLLIFPARKEESDES